MRQTIPRRMLTRYFIISGIILIVIIISVIIQSQSRSKCLKWFQFEKLDKIRFSEPQGLDTCYCVQTL